MVSKNNKKVVCAMSGGVDSSVAAALLKKEGYKVVGVFMRMHNFSNPEDAKKTAKKLGIDFKIIDTRKEFKKRVIDYFIKEYVRGRTPNPCVECNRWIKFNFLIEEMLKQKADFVATGHYTRLCREFSISNSQFSNKLLTARDKTKDQSYFLWTLNQKQLSKILFPVGDYTKNEIKKIAKDLDLPAHKSKESQEICFINTNLHEFLRKRINTNKGLIITKDGKKVGEHEGLAFYTIGQRKGIGIGGIGPFYVIDKNYKKNELIVAQGDFNKALFKKEMLVKKINWINETNLPADRQGLPLKCKVKIRYLHPAMPATINEQQTMNNEQLKVFFNKKQRAITPGQSAVFYRGNEVLGGGIIC